MIKPDYRFNIITDITPEFCKEKGIKGFILDVDNTLIDLKKNKIPKLDEWIEEILKAEIKIAFVSNGRKKVLINDIAKKYNILYITFALKPFKKGIKKAKKILELEYEEIAEVGDQVFTDVLVSNRCKMISILTKPIELEKKCFQRFKRYLERKVLENGGN